MRNVLLLALSAGLAWGQTKFQFWPGAQYDPAIPTFQKVLGYEPAARIAPVEDTYRYFEALAAASGGRLKVFDYGKSWENRRLILVAISSESNIRRLNEIQQGIRRLGDPRKTSEAEARKLIATLPATVMLGYSVHGNEISSTDAAMLAAYHLLAARNDRMASGILQNSVVLIDPLQNPDGRNRFVHHFETTVGLEHDATPFSAEHDEPWPGARSNHYHFDMNRDWFALTQPETRARIKLFTEWLPLVFADLHEMGGETTYYFAPEAAPFNPHITEQQKKSLDIFGKNNAKYFDQLGFPYFTREVFDDFYPGYGAGWPLYYGGIGMTYENASLRGMKYQRGDGTVVDYPQSVQKHFVASIATAEAAADNRETLLRNFYEYRRTAVEEGRTEETKDYILSRKGDVALVDKLADLLAAQGIEVERARTAFSAGGKDFPAGSYRISSAQPMKRMIRTLLDPVTPLDKDFVAEQERRRKRKLRDEIYDVTAWSLPLQYNVEAVLLKASPSGVMFDPVAAGNLPQGRVEGGRATVSYLVPWTSIASGKLLTALLRENLLVYSSDKAFTQNGRKFDRGTLIIPVAKNPASVHDTVARLAASSGAEVLATNSGWVEDGVNWGSNYVLRMAPIRVAMVWDAPVSAYSAGYARWLLERQFGYPVTLIRASRLAGADLSRFHVLILPEGNGYGGALSGAAPRLKAWVQNGGTLVSFGTALPFLADARVGLLSLQQESAAKTTEPAKPAPAAGASASAEPVPGKIFAKEEDFRKAIEADREPPDEVAGVLVRAKLDKEHWLTAGVPETVHALVSGRLIFSPLKLDKGINAAIFAGPDELLASGYLWDENRKQLAYKPFVAVQREGRGLTIGFTADPNYRGYMDGLNLLFLNAVFRGAAHAGGAFAGGGQ